MNTFFITSAEVNGPWGRLERSKKKGKASAVLLHAPLSLSLTLFSLSLSLHRALTRHVTSLAHTSSRLLQSPSCAEVTGDLRAAEAQLDVIAPAR